jgi:hypothetical protein
MKYKVNCWVPPKHSPEKACFLGRRRVTFTVSREFDNLLQAVEFIDNVRDAGQLKKLRGILLMPQEEKPLNDVSPLSEQHFSAEERPENFRRYSY